MDFVKLFSARQKKLGYSDSQMAELTGINEYTFYNIKQYRTYLTKVAYYAIASVLHLNIDSDESIALILKENNQIVGVPQSNLSVAAESVNPETLKQMEKELIRLSGSINSVEQKEKVINSLRLEIDALRKEKDNLEKKLKRVEEDAYSKGVKEGSEKVQNMRAARSDSFNDFIISEYNKRIEQLERGIKRAEDQYAALYKYVSAFEEDAPNLINFKGFNLKEFEKPLKLQKEELGITISEDLVSLVMSCYYQMGLSKEEIMKEIKLDYDKITEILENYKEVRQAGKTVYVKKH